MSVQCGVDYFLRCGIFSARLRSNFRWRSLIFARDWQSLFRNRASFPTHCSTPSPKSKMRLKWITCGEFCNIGYADDIYGLPKFWRTTRAKKVNLRWRNKAYPVWSKNSNDFEMAP